MCNGTGLTCREKVVIGPAMASVTRHLDVPRPILVSATKRIPFLDGTDSSRSFGKCYRLCEGESDVV